MTGGSFNVTAYEVDDDCGAGQPVLMGQWDYVHGVLRVGTKDEMVDRAYVMDGLGKWENPGPEVIFPSQPEKLSRAGSPAWIVRSRRRCAERHAGYGFLASSSSGDSGPLMPRIRR